MLSLVEGAADFFTYNNTRACVRARIEGVEKIIQKNSKKVLTNKGNCGKLLELPKENEQLREKALKKLKKVSKKVLTKRKRCDIIVESAENGRRNGL